MTFQKISSRPFYESQRPLYGESENQLNSLDVVGVRFEGLPEVVEQKEDDELLFKVHKTPLQEFFLELQKIKPRAFNKQAACFLEPFQSMSPADQNLFVEVLFSRVFSEEDLKLFIREKQAKAFSGISAIPVQAIRETAEESLMRALMTSEKLSDTEKRSWVLTHLNDHLDKLPGTMEAFLLRKVSELPLEEQTVLYVAVRQIAIGDKVEIPGWDREWGKHHLQDNAKGQSPWAFRLARALSAVDVLQRQKELDAVVGHLSTKWDSSVIRRLLKHCDALVCLRNGRETKCSDSMLFDVMSRAEALTLMNSSKAALSSKHPQLGLMLADASHPLFRLWKREELNILFSPLASFSKTRFERLRNKLAGLLDERISPEDAETLLEVILKQAASHPRLDQVKGEVDLREIRQQGQTLALRGEFKASGNSRCKDIFTISSPTEGKTIGKYKHNHQSAVAKEVSGYWYDSLLGLGITPPTGMARLSLKQALLPLENKFALADEQAKLAKQYAEVPDLFQAALCKDRAEALHREAMALSSILNESVLRALYECIKQRLTSESRENVGHDLWWNQGGCQVGDEYRRLAIQDYLRSEAYHGFIRNHSFEFKDEQGSIQRWMEGSYQRVIDFIVNDPTAGNKLKQLPKSLVHLYCILGLLKGSEDGFSGNALITFTEEDKLGKIHEFDDEMSMPTENSIKRVRIWQFGLPQADVPFDLATLLMFSDPEILNRILAYNKADTTHKISIGSYEAQEARMKKMGGLFQTQLALDVPTLTPRDLFFEIFGGRGDYKYWHEERGMNPWHVFEYCLGEVGAGAYFNQEHEDRTILNKNLEDLYSGL